MRYRYDRYDRYGGYGFAPYKNQATRKREAKQHAEKLRKKGHECCPVVLEGRTIARSFWGRAWCDHMESFHDYSNRLPRGRTYVRNGSVFDLQIKPGKVTALVSGTEIYEVEVTLKPLADRRWEAIRERCAGQVASVVELLQGKFSDAVMQVLTDPEEGMFPAAREFTMDCSCPDGAGMCKHIAAVLYGIGSRLDDQPELFFTLRDVDHTELIAAATAGLTAATDSRSAEPTIAAEDLSEVFGVEIDTGTPAPASTPSPAQKKAKARPVPKAAARRSRKAKK